jgi:hypothetical protein
MRKVLQCETGRWSGGDRCWFGWGSASGKRRVTINDTVIIITVIIIGMFGPFCLFCFQKNALEDQKDAKINC